MSQFYLVRSTLKTNKKTELPVHRGVARPVRFTKFQAITFKECGKIDSIMVLENFALFFDMIRCSALYGCIMKDLNFTQVRAGMSLGLGHILK